VVHQPSEELSAHLFLMSPVVVEIVGLDLDVKIQDDLF
jgi:hypothetical protein